MQDVFAYCADLVRAADRDRFIAALFAPAERRGALSALYAFNAEVARVRDVAREPLPGEIRLQWWSEVVNGERAEEAAANPVAAAMLATIARYKLPAQPLVELIEARRFDVYDEPMATVADLETYAEKTASAVFALAAQILAGADVSAVARPAGIAHSLANLMHALPANAARGQLYLPLKLLDRHGVRPDEISVRRSSPGLNAALAELRVLAHRHLRAAGEQIRALPSAAVPALLPLTLVCPMLDRLARGDPFAPADIPPWRRQWLIWRAARNPARIAGSSRG